VYDVADINVKNVKFRRICFAIRYKAFYLRNIAGTSFDAAGFCLEKSDVKNPSTPI